MRPEKEATEIRGLDKALELLPKREAAARTLMRRFAPHWALQAGGAVLDVGAAQGVATAAWQRLGFDALVVSNRGAAAVETSRALAAELGVEPVVEQGFAEDLPYDDASFDLVVAQSVLEHVVDPQRVFEEVFRVLKPGGAFYFHTSSALGFRQREIKYFPLFPWYPSPVKRRIMSWVRSGTRHSSGHTEYPAVNWFTPWGVLLRPRPRRLHGRARSAGSSSRNRSCRDEPHGLQRRAGSAPGRFVGEVLQPGSGFLAIR